MTREAELDVLPGREMLIAPVEMPPRDIGKLQHLRRRRESHRQGTRNM